LVSLLVCLFRKKFSILLSLVVVVAVQVKTLIFNLVVVVQAVCVAQLQRLVAVAL
jgi:hypothetical protein